MRKLPTTLWNQFNQGETILGNLNTLLGSFNLDLTTNLGKTRSSRMLANTTQAVNTVLTGPAVGFKWFNSSIFTATGTGGSGEVHSSSGTPEAAFSGIGTSLKPAACDAEYSDIEVFFNTIYVSQKDTVVYRSGNGTSWTPMTVGIATAPHMFCVFASRMYMSATPSTIHSWNEANTIVTTGQYTFEIPNTYAITWMRATSNRIFIGTINTKKGRALIYEWDGSSSTLANKTYEIEASGALSCVVKDDIPYVLDSNGRLLKWNGGNFAEIARLPVKNKYLKNPLSLTNNRFIHPNGMAIVNGKINLLINNELYDSGTPILEFCPSGIWEYDENLGLYHKNSLSLSLVGGAIRDYGQNRVSAVGGLADMKIDSAASGRNGNLLAGATLFTNATTTSNFICTNDLGTVATKAGHIITPEFSPPDPKAVSSMWQKIYLSILALKNSTDRIEVKYRITKRDSTEMAVTLGSSSFTTTDANMANYAVGDEVEITRGDGGGQCVHITSIAVNAGTYTVGVDRAFPNVTVTATARLQKWIKIGSLTSDIVTSIKEFPVGKQNNWIQFKIYFEWAGDNEFLNYAVVDRSNKEAE